MPSTALSRARSSHAGEDGVAVPERVVQVGDAAGVAGAFLEGDEILHGGQLGEQFRGDVVPVADRIVVDHDGKAGGLGHGAEVGQHLVLVGGLVDHGGHEHEAVAAHGLHVAHVLAGLGGAGLGHAAEHGDPAAGGLDHLAHDQPLFPGGEHLVLAEGPEENQPLDPGIHQHAGMAGGAFQVEGAVLEHLGGDGGEHTGPDVLGGGTGGGGLGHGGGFREGLGGSVFPSNPTSGRGSTKSPRQWKGKKGVMECWSNGVLE
jgi:hypothetical protein